LIKSFSWVSWNTVSGSTLLLVALDYSVAGGLRLDTEVVLSSSDKEITVHSPSLSVGVSHDPELGAGFVVDAPANDDYGVVEIHPGDAIVFEITVSEVLLLVLSDHLLSLFVVLSDATVLEIRGHLGFMIVGKDTFLIE